MKYEVLQSTHYQYSLPVRESINQCIFKPIGNDNQTMIQYEQAITPSAVASEHRDYWGNEVVTFYIWEPHSELQVRTRTILDLHHKELVLKMTDEIEAEMNKASFKQTFAEFLMSTRYTQLNSDIIHFITSELKRDQIDLLTFVEKLNSYIYEQFSYLPGSTDVTTVASDAFFKKTGVCQDFTHIMLGICRSQGIPARYVSGYIYSGEDVAMRGDSVTHAWVEVYFPTYGWIGFDPTNNMIAQNQHICVATGRDYADITPLKGVHIGNGYQDLKVSISVKAAQ